MGYVGNQTTTAFTSMDKQDIAGNGGTSYTLSHSVANANEIEVFVNNVRQEPSVAYSVSGTTLTMTGNVASTDDFYVVFQGKAVGTIVPPDGSVGTAKIADDAVTNAKIDTVAASKLTGALPALDGSALTGIDTLPTAIYFYVHRTGGNVSSTNTIVYNVADSNQGNAYSTSTGIFTAPQTGLYWFGSTFLNQGGDCDVQIRVDNNATGIGQARASSSSNHVTASWSGVVYLTANQNVRCVVTQGTIHGTSTNRWTTFTGYLIR